MRKAVEKLEYDGPERMGRNASVVRRVSGKSATILHVITLPQH